MNAIQSGMEPEQRSLEEDSPGKPVIYGSLSYSCAMLKTPKYIPAAHRFVIVEVPNNVLKLFFYCAPFKYDPTYMNQNIRCK